MYRIFKGGWELRMKQKRKYLNLRPIFYFFTVLAVALFLIGQILYQWFFWDLYMNNTIDSEKINLYDTVTSFIPYCISLWLFIIGVFFVKKNKLVIAICVVTGILHLIGFYVVWAYSEGSIYPVFDWLIEVLSFGLIKLPGGWR